MPVIQKPMPTREKPASPIEYIGKMEPIAAHMYVLENAPKDMRLPTIPELRAAERSENAEELRRKGFWPALSGYFLIYPGIGKTFRKGTDFEDMYGDSHGRKLIVPASSIPEEAIGLENACLCLPPTNIDPDNRRTIIEAVRSTVITHTGFPQEERSFGKPDPVTLVPLIDEEVLAMSSEERRRTLCELRRISGDGIRVPIIGEYRYGLDPNNHNSVYAGYAEYKNQYGFGYVLRKGSEQADNGLHE